MRKISLLVLTLLLSSCANMTPTQKTVMWVVGGVLVIGALDSGSGDSPVKTCTNNPIGFPDDSGIHIPPCP
jgi:hypothetical protein